MNDIYETENRLDEFWQDGFQLIRGFGNFEYFKENKIKIASLVKDGNIRGFDNQLMWSFYGEKYQGVCLIFDKKKITDSFNETYETDGEIDDILYELEEPEKLCENEIIDLKGTPGNTFDKRVFVYDKNSNEIWRLLKIKDRYKDLFFRKNNQWQIENEYRFLIYDNNKPNLLTLKTPSLYFEYQKALIGVIVGPKFNIKQNDERFKFLKELGEKNNFEVYSSKYKNYRIIPNRIHGLDGNKEIKYNEAFITFENS